MALIKTTLVGSYPVPDWLVALPGVQALEDATAVVLKVQENAGIDLLVDGELYRFDVNHPETNGMIDYFVRPLGNVRTKLSREDLGRFRALEGMSFRARPAAVVTGELNEGSLDLIEDCRRVRALTRGPLKFTVTGPHMLCKTLLDLHYGSTEKLCRALAGILAGQVKELEAEVVQVDEANITGHPGEAEWAAECINIVLEAIPTTPAVHLCFGNYGGQTIQKGTWEALTAFMGRLRCDHVLVEMAFRGPEELKYLAQVDPRIGFGVGVIDIKSNIVESADQVARRIGQAVKALGAERVKYVNPDCGFWMLKRSVADRKIRALVQGRDLFEGGK
ncbi:MAG: methionine synthase [Candidatus Glassbacteria bacterium RIFCSPLOWO2_12_FULL_58_11]|uniref:Methionine synthase n=1 Tax=Candidatus Glassbacteria bacterium RIFCSPLOWO2_12_FULL_58_11 TaxID=1817867 RepID=A0A1F5YT35_9BACT|nr:MAG: methionine synthase [Candidatus Glassbacteria bacterium RIFCSPLOWO2_12_FULL_58_11]